MTDSLLAGYRVLVGRWVERRGHKALLKSLPTVQEAIQHLKTRWNVPEGEMGAAPIFIFSAGWRSGSTLLQRLILSSDDVLIWGEPYAHCDIIRRMADSLRAIGSQTPPDQFFIDFYLSAQHREPSLSNLWVANLYPMPSDLIAAHRRFFGSLFCEPAERVGFGRWGIKEVRLSADYAVYLKFLFPNAKFLFLYRNPYQAYRSYTTFRVWYDRWPEEPVFTARHFGAIWRRLIESFELLYREVDGRLVRFEDLASGDVDIHALSNYLGLAIKPDVLTQKVTGQRITNLRPLTAIERWLLRSQVEPVARRLGYSAG